MRVPISLTLEHMRSVQQLPLTEMGTDDLQSNGKPAEKPHGIDMAGSPAKFAPIV